MDEENNKQTKKHHFCLKINKNIGLEQNEGE